MEQKYYFFKRNKMEIGNKNNLKSNNYKIQIYISGCPRDNAYCTIFKIECKLGDKK